MCANEVKLRVHLDPVLRGSVTLERHNVRKFGSSLMIILQMISLHERTIIIVKDDSLVRGHKDNAAA